MRIAYRMAKGGDIPPEMFRMETVWRDPSTPTYTAKADAATKLYANGMGVIPKERARIDMGYTIAEREEMAAWDEQESPMNMLLGGAQKPAGQKPGELSGPGATPPKDTAGA